MLQLGISDAEQFANHTTSVSAVVQRMKLVELLSEYDSRNEDSVQLIWINLP